jgi:uncharacterized protein
MSVGIWEAARRGDLAEVERLMGQHPALLNARDGLGCTPLMFASRHGRVGVVRWLLDKGAAINARAVGEFTALCLASQQGRLPVVRLLLERGADPTIAGYWGATPLIEAAPHGHLEIVRLILGHSSGKTTLNPHDHSSSEPWESGPHTPKPGGSDLLIP